MVVERLRTVGVYLLKGGVAILAIVQTGSDCDFPVAERRTVLKTELSILFRRTEAASDVYKRQLHVCPRIVPVYGT